MRNILNLKCNIKAENQPWALLAKEEFYSDLTFVINGEKHHYHQAILAQHSSMFRDLLMKSKCCVCMGIVCFHEPKDIVISLGNVNIDIFKIVMEIVYDGCGKVPNDVNEFKSIVNMLNLDSFFIKDLNGNSKVRGNDKLSNDGMLKTYNSGRNTHPEKISSEVNPRNRFQNVGEKDVSSYPSCFENENFSVSVHNQEFLLDEKQYPEEKLNSSDQFEENLACDLDSGDEDSIEEADINYDSYDDLTSSVDDIDTSKDISLQYEGNNFDESAGKAKEIKYSKKSSDTNLTGMVHKLKEEAGSNLHTFDKMLLEDSLDSVNSDTLSEYTGIDNEDSNFETAGTSVNDKPDADSENDINLVAYHCPFEDCSFNAKKTQEFYVHIGAKHYRTKIQELYPTTFINKYCQKCQKFFSVAGNYYTHMAKHENFKYMNKSDIGVLMKSTKIVNDIAVVKHKEKRAHSEYMKTRSPIVQSQEKYKTGMFSDDSFEANLKLLEDFAYDKPYKETVAKFQTNLTEEDEDEIIEISPPKRKSQVLDVGSSKKSKTDFIK